MRRCSLLILLILSTVSLAGQAAISAPSAADVLKGSMAKYASLRSFRARCLWIDVFAGQPKTPTSKTAPSVRTILFAAPNRFKMTSSSDPARFLMTSVCDGKRQLETTNPSKFPPMAYPAPPSLARVRSMQMQHPMFNGTLLYQFFGGPANLPNLVKLDNGPISYGEDTVVDGVRCRTICFYGQQSYGHTRVAIGINDHLVHRIVYDSEPLMAIVRQQMKQKIGDSISTENYEQIALNPVVTDSEFKVTSPPAVRPIPVPAAASDEPPVPIGKPAPDFEVSSLNSGQMKRLSSLRGHLVLLDFWATWCPPCRESLPETQRIFKKYGGSGLVVMTISDESSATIKPFLSLNKYNFPVYRDEKNAAAKAYHVDAIPTAVIVTPKGKLAAYFVGLQDAGTIIDALNKAGLQTGK